MQNQASSININRQKIAEYKQELKHPTLSLFDRSGELKLFSQFDNSAENNNICIVGSPGSGKQTLMQEMIKSTVNCGGKALAIVFSSGFREFCEELGGNYIELCSNNPISVNPFSEVPMGNDRLSVEIRNEFVKNFAITLATMVSGEKSEDYMDDLQDKILTEALRKCLAQKNINTTIDDIADWLLSQNNNFNANNLGSKLVNYRKDGAYGGFFSGKADIFNNDLVVINPPAALKIRSKESYAVVIQAILLSYHLRRLAADRNYHNLLVVERFEDMPQCSKTLSILNEITLAAVRFPGSIVLATQNIEHFIAGSALNIFAEAGVKIVMQLCESVISNIPQMPVLQGYFYSEELIRMLKTLKVIKDEYSEFMAWGAGFKGGVFRLRKGI